MMTEDIGLRFSLAGKLMRMRYGDSLQVSADTVLRAWPPTGDHDRSFEGAFRAMSLASSGNRPEESYTTEERIKNDLDDSFQFAQQPYDGSYIFHRKVSACPKCKGTGRIRQFPDAPAFFDPNAPVSFDDVITVTVVDCDHAPSV
jgi:hypothetical protein